MKTIILKQSLTIAAFALIASGSAYAGGFVDVLNSGERTPGSTNNSATDPFFLGELPSTWALLATQTSAVYSPVTGYTANQVGTFIDSVWLDSASNSYIFGSYFQLNNSTNGITEINSIVRSSFADYSGTISAAWVYADDVYSFAPTGGYKLQDPSRSDYVASYNATAAGNNDYFNADKVAIRTDISIGEENPNSGLYLIKVSAAGYTYKWEDDAVRIVQGASTRENGRKFADMTIGGFAVTAVPEAETYAMMMAGLAMIGSIVRRRKSA